MIERGSGRADPSATAGRVLVVDDDDIVRRTFRNILTRGGYSVLEARNVGDALALVGGGEIDVVLTDVHMPGAGGVELLEAIRQRDPDLPVLLISGEPDLETAMKAVEYGAVEYIQKPIQIDKLRSSAERALELRRERLRARSALQAQSSGRRNSVTEGSKEREDLTGVLIGGRYRIGALIGVGGMGAVYEATREDLGNMSVAIKVLHPSSATDADLARFRREAHTVAAIDHPNIVRIIDFETPPDEPAFLVMERLSGTSLGETMKNEGSLSAERTVFIAGQLLGALAAAHAVNVVHRDLKPDNVYLTTVAGVEDIVKLLDFGIAKSLAPDVDVRLTQTGAVLGTPAYMAPEQARGAAVDHRCDLYAVGSLMYEALTGRPPFRAENYNALLFEIQNADPMDLATLRPDLDLDLVSLIAKATAREPADRFQTSQAMLDALGRWGAPPSRSQIAPRSSSSAAFAPTEVHPSEAEKPSSGPVHTGPKSMRRASVPAQKRRQASKRK